MHTDLKSILTKHSNTFKQIVPFDFMKEGVHIDLSILNDKLEKVEPDNSEGWERYIWNFMQDRNAKFCAGGYLEERSRYVRSSSYHTEEGPRIIHLGTDIWINAGTQVSAPLEGRIHSFKDNSTFFDYGPTIILEHEVDDVIFHTLYGHLSRESLKGKTEKQTVKAGEVFSEIGVTEINGGWPPHLHFQIIKNLEGMKGDYPGLCSKAALENFRKNCPDPDLILCFDKSR